MSTQHDSGQDSIEVVDGTRIFTDDDVAQMEVAPLSGSEEYDVLVAVAAKGGVATDDGYCNAVTVLYMTPDGQKAIEKVVRHASIDQPEKVRAFLEVASGYSRLGAPSEAVVSRHAEAIEAHREQWLDGVER